MTWTEQKISIPPRMVYDRELISGAEKNVRQMRS